MLRPQSAAGGTHLFTGRVPLLRPYFSAVCPIIVPRNGREADRLTVVYVDSVFVLNALMDYLLVLCAARLAGIPLRRRRYLLAGLLGGAYAVAVFLPGLGFLSATPVKLAAGILLALAAYGGEAKLLRLTLLLFAVSCAMAGCVLALGLVAGGGVPMVNGVFYTDVDAKVLLTAAAAAYLVLTVVFRAAAVKGVRGDYRFLRHGKRPAGSGLRSAGARGVSGAAGRCASKRGPLSAGPRSAGAARRAAGAHDAGGAGAAVPSDPLPRGGSGGRTAAGGAQRLDGGGGGAVCRTAGCLFPHRAGDGIQRPVGRRGWKEKKP